MARRGRRAAMIGQRYHRPGTAPGTLRPVETPGAGPARVTVIDYGPDHVEERSIGIDGGAPALPRHAGGHLGQRRRPRRRRAHRTLGECFGLHKLALEDVLNCGQRPKVEDYGSFHFIVVKSLLPRPRRRQRGEARRRADLIFLAGNYVITFQEVPGDSFEQVRERIRHGKGQIRRMGPDYLVYALIDALVDEFFPVLERYGERIEELEDEVLRRPAPQVIHDVHAIKRELLVLRRIAWPQRELISALHARGVGAHPSRDQGLPARLLRPHDPGRST